MTLLHHILNQRIDNLAIWVEPFCNSYIVPPGSTLAFFGEARPKQLPFIETEVTSDGLTIYFNHVLCEPDVRLDGKLIDPT